MSAPTAVLVAGYLLAVPFTLYVPGFLRMWRRRERWSYACAQCGAALIVAGWLAKGAEASAAVNAAWLVGFGVAWARAGRTAPVTGRAAPSGPAR